MPANRFDEFSKLAGARTSRRGVLKAALGFAAGSLLARFSDGSAAADHAPAVAPANDAFQRTWARTDKPVADGLANRTWMWGPEAFSEAMTEEYNDSPGGQRTVQYFDKSRMELTYPDLDPADPFYVTNGRLASELITGQMQVGDDAFIARQPAQVNIAGDPGERPTYAEIGQLGLLDAPATAPGTTITATYASGAIGSDAAYAQYGVTAAEQITVPGLDHTVASVFWEFANQSGPVYVDGATTEARLFDPWFFATGLPITEAYWSQVAVAGTPKDILWQCFERRCLTYTPDNAPGWQVEAGNVGQHYYAWRTTPQEDPEIGPAPPDIEAALIEAASGDGPYQQLAAYLIAEGFSEVSQGSTQASGPGLTPTEFLQVRFETAPPNPLRATLTFDPDMAGRPIAYAAVRTAQDELLYILYVDEASQIQPQFPSPGPGAGNGALRQLTGDAQCTSCVDECLRQPIGFLIAATQSLDSCESIAHILCEGVATADFASLERQIETFNACVSIATAACVRQETVAICEDICEDYCPDCTACPGTDETNFCCQTGCTNLDTDANNCGNCGQNCAPGQKCCGGTCIDILSDTANCGACGNNCQEGHDCINGVCTEPNPCDACPGSDLANYCCDGVCMDLRSDPNNCGGCGLDCAASQICCDGICLNPTDDDQNCGGCGTVCPPGQLCCNSACMDVLSDNQNCGFCGFECGPGEECESGICVEPDPCDECQAGEACCNGVCIDVTSDDDNCGDCGVECAAGWTCMNGVCERLPECEDASDCFGCDICVEGMCVDCPSSSTCCDDGTCAPQGTCCPGLINCGGGLCCGGNYPNCCPQYDVCCAAGYPVCCSSDFCCPASFPVCCSDDWCCPPGCTCTGNQGCHCPDDIGLATEVLTGASGALGNPQGDIAAISYW